MILRDTRPGVSFTFSYDKEGKVILMIVDSLAIYHPTYGH